MDILSAELQQAIETESKVSLHFQFDEEDILVDGLPLAMDERFVLLEIHRANESSVITELMTFRKDSIVGLYRIVSKTSL